MKIESINQSESHAKEFTAKVKTGKNYNSFYLGQKFGHIISLVLLLLIFNIGIIDCEPASLEKSKTSSLIGGNAGKRQLYTTHGFNWHSPHSVEYIDEEQR